MARSHGSTAVSGDRGGHLDANQRRPKQPLATAAQTPCRNITSFREPPLDRKTRSGWELSASLHDSTRA
jgi:hypothetical protein